LSTVVRSDIRDIRASRARAPQIDASGKAIHLLEAMRKDEDQWRRRSLELLYGMEQGIPDDVAESYREMVRDATALVEPSADAAALERSRESSRLFHECLERQRARSPSGGEGGRSGEIATRARANASTHFSSRKSDSKQWCGRAQSRVTRRAHSVAIA